MYFHFFFRRSLIILLCLFNPSLVICPLFASAVPRLALSNLIFHFWFLILSCYIIYYYISNILSLSWFRGLYWFVFFSILPLSAISKSRYCRLSIIEEFIKSLDLLICYFCFFFYHFHSFNHSHFLLIPLHSADFSFNRWHHFHMWIALYWRLI